MAETLNTIWSKVTDDGHNPEFTKAIMDAVILSAYTAGSQPRDLIISNPYMVATFRALKRFGRPVNRANRHKYRRAWLYETQFMRVR